MTPYAKRWKPGMEIFEVREGRLAPHCESRVEECAAVLAGAETDPFAKLNDFERSQFAARARKFAEMAAREDAQWQVRRSVSQRLRAAGAVPARWDAGHLAWDVMHDVLTGCGAREISRRLRSTGTEAVAAVNLAEALISESGEWTWLYEAEKAEAENAPESAKWD